MRALITQPSDRDEWAVYVVQDVEFYQGWSSWLLCGDGLYRYYPPYTSLGYEPLTPTVTVKGLDLHRGVSPAEVRALFLPERLATVHHVIQDAARTQECVPGWLREALA